MKGRMAALAVAALVGAVCTVAPARAAAAPASTGIAWGKCSDPLLKSMHAQCGYLSVPLDYSNPSGQQIQLAVSRIRHTSSAADYQGVLISNPGGPGGSGLDLNVFLIQQLQAEHFNAAVADYDWIGFDPRGVGSSKPALSCIPDYFHADRPNYAPSTYKLQSYWLRESQSYAQACDDQSALQSALLRNMTTVDVAKDVDSIRQALGQQQITYYGFSYGTDLGQTYATLFPNRVRRIVLDSNVDMDKDGYQDFNLDQDAPFNRNLDLWFAWIAKYHSVYHLGDTEAAVQHTYYNAMDALQAHPAGGVVGPDEWADLFIEPAYYDIYGIWPEWAQAFSDWVNKHQASELVALYQAVDGPGNDNEFAVYLSVLCTDSRWPLNFGTWKDDVNAVAQTSPAFAWENAWFNAPCIFWPAPSRTQFQAGSDVRSMLLIDETLDPATPFEGSLVARQLFPNSVLLAEPGGPCHACSLSGNMCVDSTVAHYLISGVLPPRNSNAKWDKTCAPTPPPNPTSGSASTGAATPAWQPLVQARGMQN